MELKAALDSPDPTAFESSLPIHQDGTCNGLQHYAALGGDDRGAHQVNLGVTDKPSDVYTHVAAMVEEQLKREIETGDGNDKFAKLLSGKISRKVVKQTVRSSSSDSRLRRSDFFVCTPGHDHCLWCHVCRRSRADREAAGGTG